MKEFEMPIQNFIWGGGCRVLVKINGPSEGVRTIFRVARVDDVLGAVSYR